MFKPETARAMRLCVAMLWSAALFACGGGGGGDSAPGTPIAPPKPGVFGAVLAQPVDTAEGIEGTPEEATLNVTISYTGTESLYLAPEIDPSVVLDLQGQVHGASLVLKANLRGDLEPGDHPTEIVLHACLDDTCTREPEGSPVRLPISYHVKPNLQVQRFLVLGRSGAEPAPSVTLPVGIPAEAGAVGLLPSAYEQDALKISFDGSALKVQTQQVPAGVYVTTITLQSDSDRRYGGTVQVQYNVSEPPDGEHVLSVDNPFRVINLQQGAKSVQRVKVTRPTWTNAWDAPVVTDPRHLLSITSLGDDEYDVTIDSAGLPAGSYSPSIRFSAGPTGGTASAEFQVQVNESFYLDAALRTHLTIDSTADDLVMSGQVRLYDGSAARWTAVSKSPWLQLTRTTGFTGVDALEVSVDPAALAQPDGTLSLPLELSVDRPGTLPQTLFVLVDNRIPWLQAGLPHTLVGGSGRVYVQGAFPDLFSNFSFTPWLDVIGARVERVQLVSDPRYPGNASVLAIELSGATAGTPVTIRIDHPLLPSEVSVNVEAPLQTVAAFQPLAYARYRPAQFAASPGAAYFSGPDTVYRWGYGGGAWTLSQAALPGVIDAAANTDDGTLYAIDGARVRAFNPQTLVQQSVGTLPEGKFDGAAQPAMNALAFSADGRALAGLLNDALQARHGVGWVCTMEPGIRTIQALTLAPRSCEPGTPNLVGPGVLGWGLVRSANGHAVIAVGPQGQRLIYRASERVWAGQAALPEGLRISAVSDNGARVLRSDGMLMDSTDRQLGALGSLVPFTHIAAGYGISSDGRFGLVYGYRITGDGAAQRATDAMLWVIDISDAVSSGVISSPVLATLAMPSAVGCTAAPASGETCEHLASVTLAPGNGMALVLGPRGIAAVPMPPALTVLKAPPGETPASARPVKPRAASVRLPVRGVFAPH